MQTLETALKTIIQDADRLIFRGIEEKYLSDALGRRRGAAEALVFPLNTQEGSSVLRYAHENHVPVTPRGAGTNLVGSTVPVKGGIILDLSRMNRVLELDEDTMTITVEPGILLQEVQATLFPYTTLFRSRPASAATSAPMPAGCER